MKYVRFEYDNKKATNSELNGHREIIDEYTSKGYKYVGFVPVRFGPSGKPLLLI